MGLTVTELSCDRSGRPVLGGVTLEIDDGEAVLLRGPNGVGKSTLLRALAGLLPFTGAVSLDGHDLRADRDGYGERLAFAGHLDAIKPQLTVAENLGFWGALFGAASVDAALAEFDLAAIAGPPRPRLLRRPEAPPRPRAARGHRAAACGSSTSRRCRWTRPPATASATSSRAHCAAGGLALIATHVDLGLPVAREFVLAPLAAETPARSA